MRNVIDTLAIGMGGIFLQCQAVARICNAMSSLFADAMIGQILIFRRGDRPTIGDRPTPCRTRAEASRAQASFAPNNAGRKLDPSPTDCGYCGLVRYSSSAASFSREHSPARRAPRYGRRRSHRRRPPHRDDAQSPHRRACVSRQHASHRRLTSRCRIPRRQTTWRRGPP